MFEQHHDSMKSLFHFFLFATFFTLKYVFLSTNRSINVCVLCLYACMFVFCFWMLKSLREPKKEEKFVWRRQACSMISMKWIMYVCMNYGFIELINNTILYPKRPYGSYTKLRMRESCEKLFPTEIQTFYRLS